ncbi:MAG: 3-oxoacyl-ACP synthase, partial [Planctomycetota bacterium]
AGAIDFSAMVLALYRNTINLSLNTDQPDSVCKFCFAQRDPKDRPVQQAVSTASAMSGGQSAALVVRRFSE